jgi:hypothetical protein
VKCSLEGTDVGKKVTGSMDEEEEEGEVRKGKTDSS